MELETEGELELEQEAEEEVEMELETEGELELEQEAEEEVEMELETEGELELEQEAEEEGDMELKVELEFQTRGEGGAGAGDREKVELELEIELETEEDLELETELEVEVWTEVEAVVVLLMLEVIMEVEVIVEVAVEKELSKKCIIKVPHKVQVHPKCMSAQEVKVQQEFMTDKSLLSRQLKAKDGQISKQVNEEFNFGISAFLFAGEAKSPGKRRDSRGLLQDATVTSTTDARGGELVTNNYSPRSRTKARIKSNQQKPKRIGGKQASSAAMTCQCVAHCHSNMRAGNQYNRGSSCKRHAFFVDEVLSLLPIASHCLDPYPTSFTCHTTHTASQVTLSRMRPSVHTPFVRPGLTNYL
ncbi:involucrin-like [Penaeus chinensis]|uniref:involucrin-like n=1 Tax=Penaeus chinensis TaxID=139456 RepID=UPI001FB5E134|nr:involucrin-like [Penaeus chinensis]